MSKVFDIESGAFLKEIMHSTAIDGAIERGEIEALRARRRVVEDYEMYISPPLPTGVYEPLFEKIGDYIDDGRKSGEIFDKSSGITHFWYVVIDVTEEDDGLAYWESLPV